VQELSAPEYEAAFAIFLDGADALWRSPGLSDRGRMLGFVQMLFEAALRGNRDLDGPFAETIVGTLR
jgi:hypothetical protein